MGAASTIYAGEGPQKLVKPLLAALEHIERQGNLLSLVPDRGERLGLMKALCKETLVAWNATAARYQLTSLGSQCLAGRRVDRTKSLIRDLENAARTPHDIGSASCNLFVARVGDLQNIPCFRDVMDPGKKPDEVGGIDAERVADKIYSFIENAVSSPGSGWKRVTTQEAQELADRGNFVIGVARSRAAEGHRHIVVAVPQTMAKKAGAEIHHGPWVRDSQSPTESVRSSSRFGSSVDTPIWAAWEP
jgi:hypothetical protein